MTLAELPSSNRFQPALLGGKYSAQAVISAVQSKRRLRPKRAMFDATSAAVKPRLIAVTSSPKNPKTCAVVFSGRHGPATERLSDGATGPTGLCALRAHHTRLIKTGGYQARSFTALEAAM